MTASLVAGFSLLDALMRDSSTTPVRPSPVVSSGLSADADTDHDGHSDAAEGAADLDGDGVANFLDLESDGDGVTDVVDPDPYDPTIF